MDKAQAKHVAARDSARSNVAYNVYTLDNGHSYVALPYGSHIPRDADPVWICTYEGGNLTHHK